MNNYHDYAATVSFIQDNGTSKDNISISYPRKMPITLSKTKVDASEQNRPDKISYRLYGNPLNSWILDEANNFYLFSDYYINRTILYPTREALTIMGINIEY